MDRVVDDLVLIFVFVGNDFLPHLPSLSIGENALGLLFQIYKRMLPDLGGYLTENGSIASLERLQKYLAQVALAENRIFPMRAKHERIQERRAQRHKSQPCRLFAMGKCTRGSRCRFMHPNQPKDLMPWDDPLVIGTDAATDGATPIAGAAASCVAGTDKVASDGSGAPVAVSAEDQKRELDEQQKEKAKQLYLTVLRKKIEDSAFVDTKDIPPDEVRLGEGEPEEWRQRYYLQRFEIDVSKIG